MPFFRGSSDQKRYKVLEADTNGNLYLYNNALLCKDEIIKRLTEGNYQLAESHRTLGNASALLNSDLLET